jgi:hypothetical protein
MTYEETLIRGTIWLAILCYAANAVRPACWAAAMGLAAYLAHIAVTFQFAHGWSHAAAEAHTARRTLDVVGFEFGGGIYVNYAFTALWALEATWQIAWPVHWTSRAWWITAAVRGIFLFIIFNATVVFGVGPVRWFGAAVCLAIALTIPGGRR